MKVWILVIENLRGSDAVWGVYGSKKKAQRVLERVREASDGIADVHLFIMKKKVK